MIEVGATYELVFTVTKQDGTQGDPFTAELTVTKPDGTLDHPAVTLPSPTPGELKIDYQAVMAGLHKAVMVTTDPDQRFTEYFSARLYVSIVSYPEARNHLNITRPLPDGGAELRRFMMASTELVESKVGIIVRRDFTYHATEGGAVIVLPERPVLDVASVTSALDGGPVWHSADLIIDREAGVITPKTGMFPFYWGPWDIAYTCGRAEVAERWEHAAKEQLRHLWDTQRGSQSPAALAGEEIYTATAGWSFSVPRRVLELLEEDMVPSS